MYSTTVHNTSLGLRWDLFRGLPIAIAAMRETGLFQASEVK